MQVAEKVSLVSENTSGDYGNLAAYFASQVYFSHMAVYFVCGVEFVE